MIPALKGIAFDEEKELLVTPAYLKSLGFKLYDQEDAIASFDVEFDDDDLCYIQKDIHRQMFCVVLTPCEWEGGVRYYRFAIWVQHNIACGFVHIPNGFTELTVKHFKMIYEGIRRETL